MEHQAELHNVKPQPERLDAPPIAFLDSEQTGYWQVMFNIGEEIRCTKNGHNDNAHILTGIFSNEGMKYNLGLESNRRYCHPPNSYGTFI